MGIANIINVTGSAGGGEIIRELINSSDGQGLHFDGVAGNVDIASPPDLGTKFSFEFVIKADAWASDTAKRIIDFGTGGRFAIGTNTSDANIKIYDTAWRDFGVSVLDDLKVHHIVITVDGTAAILYDNSNQVGTTTLGANATIDACSDAKIGTYYNGGGGFLNGSIYRCRFYNKTLTQAEVDNAYQSVDIPFADEYGSQTDLVNANSSGSGTAWTGATGTTAPTGWSPAGSSRTYTIDAGTGDPAPSLKIDAGSANVGIKWGGTATLGKKHRVTFSYKCGDAATTMAYRLNDADSFVNLANSTSWATTTVEWTGDGVTGGFMLRVNESGKFGHVDTVSIRAIGAVTDYDLAFANPTQSLMVQDRNPNGADGTASAGVSQTQKIVQLNSTSARIGTTVTTPADGELLVSGKVGIDCDPTVELEVDGEAIVSNGTYGTKLTYSAGNQSGILDTSGNHDLEFRVNNSKKMVIDTAGLVTVKNAIALDTNTTPDTSGGEAFLYKHGSNGTVLSGYTASIETGSAGSRTTKLTIDSAGYSLFNCTAVPSTSVAGLALYGASGGSRSSSGSATTSYQHFLFINGNGTVGNISTSASATTYATSSDYRLKENLEPLTGALDRIEQLPVYRFNFKADSETIVDGFVAHEAQAIVPESVVGEKDAMQTVVVKEAVEAKPATYWAEGDELPEGVAVGDEKTPAIEAQEEVTEEQPDYQGIDQSKLVPLLVGAVKELKAKVEALENA